MAPRFLMLAVLLAWLPLGLTADPLLARSRSDPSAPPAEIQPKGSEPTAAVAICLLSPAAYPDAFGRVRALVPVARPTIFARGQFAEIRLERQGRILWRQLAEPTLPLQGPLAWPLPPLSPGESLLLRLRPVGVTNEDFADVELVAGNAATLAASAQLRQRLGSDPEAWLEAVLRELESPRTELALALLFDFDGPSSPPLDALRRDIHDKACASLILSPDPLLP